MLKIFTSVFNRKFFWFLLFASQTFGTVLIANAQCPGEDIIASHNGNCLPALVRFVVSPALPVGTVYYWDAGDGKGPILGGDTFYHQYITGGSYGITAKIIQKNGDSCTITKDTGFLVFYSATSLGFYADQTLICGLPTLVKLHDTTGNIVGRDWYINGNLYSDHSKDISIPITSPANLSITLIVYNKGGCPELVGKNNYINIYDIHALFCSTLTENLTHNQITANFKPGFDTTGSNVTEMDWDFPGGTPSLYTGYSPPTITYADISSPHTVTLTVKTKSGCSAVSTKVDLVRKYYSVAQTKVCQKDFASFIYEDTNAPGQMHGFNFVSSNLSISTYNIDPFLKYSIKFGSTGTADMKFGISYNFSSCTDTLTVPAMFTILPGLADFTSPDRNQCSTPATVHLHALYGNPLSGTNSYTWQIFDSLMNPVSGSPIGPTLVTDTSFSFSSNGLYTVRLITSNSAGCTDSTLKQNFIRIGTPDNNFKLSTDTLCEGDTLLISNLSTSKDDPNNPLGYSWVFQNQDSANINIKASVRSPIIVFVRPGTYDLTYTITSYLGLCPSTKVVKSAVYVQGVAADIKVSNNVGCLPLTKTVSANILENIPAGPLTYLWSVQPSIGAIIQNPTSFTTNIQFNNSGCYNVTLTIKTKIGCQAIITKNNFICLGTKADFSVPQFSCRLDTLGITNNSTLNPDQFKWTVTPANGVFINNDTLKTPRIALTQPGCYSILLQTSKKSDPNCFDTISHQVCVNVPKLLDVYSPDTSKHCAPSFDQFYANAVNATSFYWDFGDGTKTIMTDSQPKHGYFKNNNLGYTIKVAAINQYGCPSDTLTLKKYIKIAGPEPRFTITSKPPCNGGIIKFTNKSTYVYKYYFLYGDNSGVDSNQIQDHFYKFVDYTKDSNIYIPTLFAYDETGCVATANDTVKLYRPPFAGFFTKDTFGCAPFTAHFTDTSKYASTYAWDFGDGTTDTASQPVHIYTSASLPGIPYIVTLQVLTDKGCVSTAKPINVTVNPVPIIKMSLPKLKYICYQDSVHFKASSNIAMSRYSWKFGDSTLSSDTSNLQNPVYHYQFPGRHTVSLVGYSTFGCKDSVSDSTTIVTMDTIPPLTPKIYYVTVTQANTVEIVYNKQTDPKFSFNTVYRYPGPVPIYKANSNIDTVLTDLPPQIDATKQSYGYTIRTTDVCGHTSPFARTHFTIFLTVNKFGSQSLILNWNKYIGWDSVSKYEIYRRTGKNQFKLYSTVSNLDSTFIDSMLCPDVYTYYVSAIYPNRKYISNSNIALDTPDYIYPTTPVLLRKATVINNKEVEVNWDPAEPVNFKYYQMDRIEGLQSWQNNYATTTGLSYIDYNTDVNKYSYQYRLKVVDRCGFTGPESNIGTTILLNGSVYNDTRHLNWNSYLLWFNGVNGYHIQLEQSDGSFSDLAINFPSDTLYLDSMAHNDLGTPTCYRVYAVQNSGSQNQGDTSVSNIECLNLPARLFIPNAFTPNGDSLNETFKPIGLSIFSGSDNSQLKYDFKIYNRWGQMIFETNDVKKGWDGTYKGVNVPMDVYVYIIDAHGFNAEKFYIRGQVTLIR